MMITVMSSKYWGYIIWARETYSIRLTNAPSSAFYRVFVSIGVDWEEAKRRTRPGRIRKEKPGKLRKQFSMVYGTKKTTLRYKASRWGIAVFLSACVNSRLRFLPDLVSKA